MDSAKELYTIEERAHTHTVEDSGSPVYHTASLSFEKYQSPIAVMCGEREWGLCS